MSETRIRNLLSVVAGLQFYDLPALAPALQQGVRLRPQRDICNPADRNAISLWLERSEAERWDLIDLIADQDPHRQRWMLGHLQRQIAAKLAPHMDEGKALEVYVVGGDRDGAWSVNVRLEGTAIEAVEATRAAEEEWERKSQKARKDAYEAREQLGQALHDLAVAFPFEGWEKIWVRLEYPEFDEEQRSVSFKEVMASLSDGNADYFGAGLGRYMPPSLRDLRERLADADWEQRRAQARRRKDVEDTFLAPLRAIQEQRQCKRQAARREKRVSETQAFLIDAIATAAVLGEPARLPRGAEPYLPSSWLTREQVVGLGLRPEHCKIVGVSTTARGGDRFFYAGQVDEARVDALREAQRKSAARRRMRQKNPPLEEVDDIPF